MFALGAAQLVVGGVLLFGVASCISSDCRLGKQILTGIAVPVMVVGGVFVLAPGAVMWGVGSRL